MTHEEFTKLKTIDKWKFLLTSEDFSHNFNIIEKLNNSERDKILEAAGDIKRMIDIYVEWTEVCSK